MIVNDPTVIREIEAAFAAYDRALAANDISALNGFFRDSPSTVRFGNAENLYGYAEIAGYRGRASGPGAGLTRERTVIMTFGLDYATVCTLTHSPQPGKIGRTLQCWVRLPEGWRIVAAHVSTIDKPPEG